MIEVFSQCYKKVQDWVVPPLCLLCERIVFRSGSCCPACWSKIKFISPPYCDVLGLPFSHDIGQGALSAEAIVDPPPFAKLRSVVIYDENVRRLVTQLKYSDRLDLAPWMAKWMVRTGAELITSDKLVVPVPLHPMRLVRRRYNQSSELARNLCKETQTTYAPEILTRIKATNQQVGLNEKEREKNVRGAFRVSVEKKSILAGRSVLLIDDVYTSGATAKAATRALKRSGAGRVDILTFARVIQKDFHLLN